MISNGYRLKFFARIAGKFNFSDDPLNCMPFYFQVYVCMFSIILMQTKVGPGFQPQLQFLPLVLLFIHLKVVYLLVSLSWGCSKLEISKAVF